MPRSLVFLLMLFPLAASANPGVFSGDLTVFLGRGTPAFSPGFVPGDLQTYQAFHFAFIDQPLIPVAVTAGAFSGNQFLPSATGLGGTVPLPTAPNSTYLLGQVVNQTSGAGSFAPGAGPAGGFGGTMDLGMVIHLILGIAPLPNVFGSIALPLGAGSPGTQTAMATILGNAVTATAFGNGWTTGQVRYGTGVSGTPLATAGTVTGYRNVSTSFSSHWHSGPSTLFRQTISLVTPILIQANVAGSQINASAGYASLRLELRQVLVPEPALGILLAAGGLVWIGRRRGRARSARS